MKTDFWTSGNHFFPFSVVIDSSQLLPMEAVSYLTRTYWKRGNGVFICYLSIVICLSFGKLLILRGSQFFKTNHIPASGHQFCNYFGIRRKQF